MFKYGLVILKNKWERKLSWGADWNGFTVGTQLLSFELGLSRDCRFLHFGQIEPKNVLCMFISNMVQIWLEKQIKEKKKHTHAMYY